MIVHHTSGTRMTEPKLEVPAELRELAEKTIDQAERAFGMFFDAARRSTSTAAPTPVQELSKLVLAFSEESLTTSFEYARKLALTSSLQEAANLQAELVLRQIGGAQQHIRELARATGTKGQT
jgi:Phasin protein